MQDLKKYHVPNLDRALLVLEVLAKHAAGLNRNELASLTACSPTMIYRICMTLTHGGFLLRNEETGVYRLSRKLLDLGCQGSDEYSLAALAYPEMVALRDETGVTNMLGCLYNDEEGVVLEVVESRNQLRFVVEKGFRTSDFHTGAGWKSILAFLPSSRLQAIVKKMTFKKFTEYTLLTAKAFLNDLSNVREKGYALDRQEATVGIHCIAAPIFNRKGEAIGTINMSGFTDQLPQKDFDKNGLLVKRTANRISRKLGYEGWPTSVELESTRRYTGIME
jgi:DNA-binding IclR family transcriptional regulator